jgi:glycosyltransferase involved in cell wall biosynthesis
MPPTSAPRVSVLVTTYQHEAYVAEALAGVVAQRCPFAYEVMVGDDGSSDGTAAVIRAFAEANPTIVTPHITGERLGHDGRALFAELLGRARGEYIAWLDGDDVWTSPRKLERQVRYLERHPACAMVFHNAIRRIEGAGIPDRRFNRDRRARDVSTRELLRHNLVAALSPMFRRGAIDPLPEWYVECPWGDWPLYVLASQRGTIRFLPEVMGVYRVHRHGMLSAMDRLEVLRRNTRFYEQIGPILGQRDRPVGRRMLAASWAAQALEHRRREDRDAAGAAITRCLRIAPGGLGPALHAEAQRMLAGAIAGGRARTSGARSRSSPSTP